MNRTNLILVGLFGVISILTGCNKEVSAPVVKAETILDVTQYARMSSDELLEKLGEPLRRDEWIYENPNGETYPATSYFFEDNHFPIEFIAVENEIIKLNVLASQSEVRTMEINKYSDLLSLVGISPSENIEKVMENSVTARYISVNDTVNEVWATLDSKSVDYVRVTFE